MRYQCEKQGCTALFDSPDELSSPVYCQFHREPLQPSIPRPEPMPPHMASEVERQKEIRERFEREAQRQDADEARTRGALHVASGTFLTIAFPDALVTAMENLIEEGIYGSNGNEVAIYLIQRQLDELRRAGVIEAPIGERDDQAFGPVPRADDGEAALEELKTAEMAMFDDCTVQTFKRFIDAQQAVIRSRE